MAELKPCPFCAGEADSEWYRDYRHIRSGEIGRSIAVYCTACHADMTICRADVPELSAADIMATLIEAWNRRDALANSTPESAVYPASGLAIGQLRHERVSGGTFEEMRAAVWKTDLPQHGDTVLAWVNEGDLIMHSMAGTHLLLPLPAPAEARS